jgi:putative DNA primase/helicase
VTTKGREVMIMALRTEELVDLEQEMGKEPDHSGAILSRKQILYYAINAEWGSAELIAKKGRGKFAYDYASKAWFIFNGNYWENDRTNQIYKFLEYEVAAEFYKGASESRRRGANPEHEKAMIAAAQRLRSRSYVENVLHLAKSLLGITGEEWDQDPGLLGVANGVIELDTGRFRKGKPEDYIRSVAPTEWMGEDEIAPGWEKFLREIFPGNKELIDYLQRLIGYAITGYVIEHRFPILWGTGRNGKDTLIETIGDVLGPDLVTTIPADSLMAIGARSGDSPQPFVYSLMGKRIAWASESEEERKINAALVKNLTGGNTRNVRALYGNPVSYKPTEQVFLITNNKPEISATDYAIWQRVVLIPFTQRFVENPGNGEMKADPRLREKLIKERSGILAWMIKGSVLWHHHHGLDQPNSVTDATKDYREDSDQLNMFVDECCDFGSMNYSDKSSNLYQRYKSWCIDNGYEWLSGTKFGNYMTMRFTKKRTNQGVRYQGVQVK